MATSTLTRVPSPTVAHLEAVAAGLARTADPAALPEGEGRRYVRLLHTDAYEAWLIAWPAETALDWHDHGESTGVFQVVSGELDEARPTPDGVTRRRLQAGDRQVIEVGDIHDVANRTPGSEALSVHVYAPPLTSMGYYRLSGDGTLRHSGVEPLDAPEPTREPASGRGPQPRATLAP